MTYLKPLIGLAGAMLLVACTNPSRFDNADNTVDLSAGANGADVAAVDRASPAFFTSSIGDRVLFAVDESTLSGEARSLLTEQAQWLTENGQFSVLIEGHADEQGTREYNLALGARRASEAIALEEQL